MTEPAFTIVVTIIGVVYVLAYAWAQLEILAYLIACWKEDERRRASCLGILWAAMNCFSFLIAHDVHYSMIRHGGLVLYDLDASWAKGLAILVVLVYWAWVAASFKFALTRWWEARNDERW